MDRTTTTLLIDVAVGCIAGLVATKAYGFVQEGLYQPMPSRVKRHEEQVRPGPSSQVAAGKKVKGRKRQVMVDTDGRGLILEPQPGNDQDRDGAPLVLRLSRRAFPFITKAFADMGFAGEGPATATCISIEIVKKPPDQVGFAVHPRRWVVERFFAWISRNRRLWKDPEATLASARAFLYAASVMLLTRRLARCS